MLRGAIISAYYSGVPTEEKPPQVLANELMSQLEEGIADPAARST